MNTLRGKNAPNNGRLMQSLLILLFVAVGALAQESVKIEIANGAVLVPVRIDENELDFLLDTGSEHTAINESAATRLGLTSSSSVEILKDYRAQATGQVKIESIRVGDHRFASEMMPTINLDSVSSALGIPVDGVLGNDILATIPFRLNYSKHELVLGTMVKQSKSAGTRIPLHRIGDEFYIPLQVVSVPVELLLDSGTNSSSLSWETWQKLSQVWQPNSVIDGVVRAGYPVPPAFWVCLPNISLGHTMLADQAVRVQRQVSSGAFSAPGFGGILGSEFLHQFEATFDLANHQIFLKKDPQFKRDPYRFTTIGIQFAKNDTGQYLVMGVWKNSPAEEMGMKAGDQIVGVNGQAAANLSLEQLSSQLHAEEGTPIRLTMRRNSVSSAVTLRTRQMLSSSRNVQDMLRASKK